jgi:lipopolysaccharide assembly outer membrane protein LptD (OstA)
MVDVEKLFSLLVLSSFFLWGASSYGQDRRIIQIQQAGSFGKDEANFPGASILLKKGDIRVKLFHKGALIESNKSFFYSKKNTFKAEGEVIFTQGDTLRMTSDFMEYDGETGKAKAWGDVFLKQPDMTLETDTLFLDRLDDLAYYETPGTIIDSASILKSNRGKYYMKEKISLSFKCSPQ